MFFKKEKMVFGPISVMFFFIIAFLSGSIEMNYCAITTSNNYSCYMSTVNYPELMWINAGLAIVSMIYLILYYFTTFTKFGKAE